MHTIYIFGLGPSHLGEMPRKIYDTISKQDILYLRTLDHPAAKELQDEGFNMQSFDSKYELYDEDFEQVYKSIVEELIELAQTSDVYYGVPGHPAVAETTVQLLLEADVPTKIIGGRSFIDDLFASVKIDPINGFQLVDSFNLNPDKIYPGHQLIIMQVFHSMIASEVKLSLMEIYPDDHKVAIIDAAGSPEQEVSWLPLFELDYFDGVHNLRSLYIPPLERDDAVHSFATLQSYTDDVFDEGGDVWAKALTGEELLEYFQEELDELKEAYAKDNIHNVVEELGDLFMQLLYQTAVGEKEGIFSLEEVLEGINRKMRRRHPHVFDGVKAETPEEVDILWEKIKEQERNGEF